MSAATIQEEAGRQSGRDATWYGLTAEEERAWFEVEPRSAL